MRVIRFIKSHRGYQRGETAGFDAAEATRLITAGVALDNGQWEAAVAAQAAAQANADAGAEAEAKAKADAGAAAKAKGK